MLDFAIPVLLFSVSTTITPGPNNIMVTASGTNFGYRRTIPHIFGIAIGLPLMIIVMGFGLGSMFKTYPWIHVVLKYAGAAYLLYLAWKIAFFQGSGNADNPRTRPFSFVEALLFQWVNPKAWMMSIGAIAAFTSRGDGVYLEVFLIALIFCITCLHNVSLWTLLGVNVKRFLTKNRYQKIFNLVMAALLVISLVLSFRQG
jgi:threonine/homoserine/homoserine lactone efflux protein